jgi:formate/nitrite transporter FocA (FNT family)
MCGILFIVLFGSLLHFTFDLSGGWRPLGIISAVNESVWEHLKLAFWPAVFWTIIEFFFVRRPAKDSRPSFILAKAIGACIMPLVIVVIFYSYTAFTGDSILAVDLSSFVIAVVIGQIVSYKLWCSLRLSRVFNLLGLALLVIGVLLFAVFTFYPPGAGIFQDSVTGGYGIVE